jgi:hypothetical protein
MNAAEYRLKAEQRLVDADASPETTFEGHNPMADRRIAEAQVFATLAISAPEEPAAELAALRKAVAELLHDAATSADSQAPAVIARFREYLPATVHGGPVLALTDDLMRAECNGCETAGGAA